MWDVDVVGSPYVWRVQCEGWREIPAGPGSGNTALLWSPRPAGLPDSRAIVFPIHYPSGIKRYYNCVIYDPARKTKCLHEVSGDDITEKSAAIKEEEIKTEGKRE